MTNEQLGKAKDIQKEMELKKSELNNVNKYIERISNVFWYGISSCNGDCSNIKIRPTETELKTMLILMKERLENCLEKLEEDFKDL